MGRGDRTDETGQAGRRGNRILVEREKSLMLTTDRDTR